MSYVTAGLALLVALAPGEGPAQDVQPLNDWDYAEDSGRSLAIASVQYSNDVSLTVQCLAGELALGIGGLPGAASFPRRLERQRADGRVEDTYWRVSGGTLTTTDSARYARSFRAGGELVLNADPEAGPPVRIRLDLPSQSDNLDRVLTACGTPLESPFDAALDVGELMTRGPSIEMPPSAMDRHNLIRVQVECLISGGRLTSCRSERQTPADPRAGAATARGANGERVGLRDVEAAEGRRVEIIVTGNRIRR